MLYKIKNRFSGRVLFAHDCADTAGCSSGIHFFITREEAEAY